MPSRPSRAPRGNLRALALTGLSLLAPTGCAEDRILAVESVCGDGWVTGTEECDERSPGCSECLTVTGFECPPGEPCRPDCGDGEVVAGEDCDPPDGLTCDASCRAAPARTGCDLGGYVITRQTTFSRDTILGQIQTSNSWTLLRLAQRGEALSVTAALYCGYQASGTVDVRLSEASVRALLHTSGQDGAGRPEGPRRGRYARTEGGGCSLDLERWYLVRGVEDRYLPRDFRAGPELTALEALPRATDPLSPSRPGPPGSTDPEGDGIPGLALRLGGNVTGTRSVAQRDWLEWLTEPEQRVAEGAVEFTIRARFDNEESVLAVTDCAPAACGLLLAGAVPARDLPARVTLRWLGAELDSPRVADVVAAEPGTDEALDLASCARVRESLPPELEPE